MIDSQLGSYRIIGQIGVGDIATVYKANDPATQRTVALKVFRQRGSYDPFLPQRFRREAKTIAKLEHPHILPIFAYGEESGAAYLVMQYVQTGSLADRTARGRLPWDEASRYLTQIGSALDYAHGHGILHRNIKPTNILIDANGNAFLTDFANAKMVGETFGPTISDLIGKPQYMSPEEWQGAEALTAASDQYSLGVILYEMLIGQKPSTVKAPAAVTAKRVSDPLPPTRIAGPITKEIEKTLFKALAKNPEQRFRSCSAMAKSFVIAIDSARSSVGEPTTLRKSPDLMARGAAVRGISEDAGRLAALLGRLRRVLWP